MPKSVTQGKTYSGNEDKYAAAHAIDRDLSTVAATETADGAGWMKIEFDKTYFIHKVVIYYWFYTNWYHPSGWCAKSEANFRQCVDVDNNVDVSVYQGKEKLKSCGTLQLTYGLEQSDQIYTLLCYSNGDTVKLSKSTGTIAVSEVQVVVISSGKFLHMSVNRNLESSKDLRMIEHGIFWETVPNKSNQDREITVI